MRKLIGSLSIALIAFGANTATYAETKSETPLMAQATPAPASAAAKTAGSGKINAAAAKVEELTFMQTIKQKYIEGDPLWMTPVLIAMIIGIALAIERIVFLNVSTINTRKFLEEVETTLNTKGVAAAKEICRNTRGPIASIYYQGLDRADEGIDMVEKSVVAYGGVQMGQLEKGLSWISLFIALSPMLGFLGTVVGMIQAFDKIVSDGQVSPTTVAGGIKVALLTTVFGLIAAMFLQLFYNYITSKIDGLVNEMEDASISLIDMLLKSKAVTVK
jgi:biopolymer transport protein ExbB